MRGGARQGGAGPNQDGGGGVVVSFSVRSAGRQRWRPRVGCVCVAFFRFEGPVCVCVRVGVS